MFQFFNIANHLKTRTFEIWSSKSLDFKCFHISNTVRFQILAVFKWLKLSVAKYSTQNKFARFVHGSTLMDHINTKTIFKEANLLPVNQINAQIKLLEVWKSMNIPAYPIQWPKRSEELKREGLKSLNKPEIMIKGHTKIQSQTFINDAALMWNNAPRAIKDCKTLGSVKKQIKIFVQTLPI